MLSDTVRKLNDMEELYNSLDTASVMSALAPVLFQIEDSDVDREFLNTVQKQYSKTSKNVSATIELLSNTIDWYKTQIENEEPVMFQSSYQLFDQEMVHDSDDVIFGRELQFEQDVQNYIVARVQKFSAWKHSGLIVAPRTADLVEHMLGLDPLYVLDERDSLFSCIREKFNEMYQSRLRYGVLGNERQPEELLNTLPDNQIGYALIYNFFHYKPVEIIGRYISELGKKIKPGGTVAFTFNDCDRFGGVALAERSYCCYTPGEIVQNDCEEAGFEIDTVRHLNQSTTWVELRKPGELTSIKGGQSLIQVKTK